MDVLFSSELSFVFDPNTDVGCLYTVVLIFQHTHFTFNRIGGEKLIRKVNRN